MRVTVIRSTVIDAPIERVWAELRDFGALCRWHPSVAESRLENDAEGDQVGGVRCYHLPDGAEMRELLLQHSDQAFTLSYCILDSSLPLFDFTSTIRLRPVTDGSRTFWDWRSGFNTRDDLGQELKARVDHEICEAAFAGMKSYLSGEQAHLRSPASEPSPAASLAGAGSSLTCRVVVAAESGDPSVMALTDGVADPPGPREVRIRQTAIAINYNDIRDRRGFSNEFHLPGTPGVEGVGEIIDAGEKISGFLPGDRVACISRTRGAYADIRSVDADACIPVPDGVSDIDASILLKGLTAGLLLTRVFKASRGETVLIQASAGGLGHIFSQWARSMDVTVIGTVSTPEKARFSLDNGTSYPVVAGEDTPLADDVTRITGGRGVDYWVHSSGSGGIDTAMSSLALFGHCAVIGARDKEPVSLNLDVLKRRSLTLSAPVCFDYFDDRPFLQRLAHQLFVMIENRTIIPAIETFPLDRAADAHTWIESRKNMGAAVLIP